MKKKAILLIILLLAILVATFFFEVWNCHCGIDGCTIIPAHCHQLVDAWSHVH